MNLTPHPSVSPFRSGRSSALALCAAAAAAALLARPAAAEEPAGFTERLDVRVVHLEAVVTRAGERVENLRAEDFRLRVDGEEVPIEYFSEIRGGVAVDSEGALESGGSGDGTSASLALPSAPTGKAVATRFLIFIDDEFTIPARRNAVLRRIADQARQLGPQDRVAVVGWNGQRVELLSCWRPGDEELGRVLRRAMNRPAYGLQRLSEWSRVESERRYDRRSPGSGSSFSTIGFSGASRGFDRSTDRVFDPLDGASGRAVRLGSALTSALRGFAQPPGRKVLLFLSGGLPPVPRAFARQGGELERLRLEDRARGLFAPAVETANRLGYSIYPVDLGGVESRAFGAAAAGSLGRALIQRQTLEERERSAEDLMRSMAADTGGLALLDGASRSALTKVREDTRSYYWIGFSPAWRGDDRRRRVEIEVDPAAVSGSRRVRIRTRSGFQDLSRSARAAMQVESAHLFELPLPSGDGFAVTLGGAERAGRGRVVVPVELQIPAESLSFLPAGEGGIARLELRVAATDDRGDSTEIPLVPLEIRRDQVSEGAVRWRTRLELRERQHRLLIAVHDPLSDALFARRIDYDPSADPR
ncbi:MAG: VWA domain-containing protein [Acidobacteriota bacterium]